MCGRSGENKGKYTADDYWEGTVATSRLYRKRRSIWLAATTLSVDMEARTCELLYERRSLGSPVFRSFGCSSCRITIAHGGPTTHVSASTNKILSIYSSTYTIPKAITAVAKVENQIALDTMAVRRSVNDAKPQLFGIPRPCTIIVILNCREAHDSQGLPGSPC